MPNYDELIKQSEDNVKLLSEKLKKLDEFQSDIQQLLKQPEVYKDHIDEFVEVTEKFAKELNSSTQKYIDINNSLLTKNLNLFSEKIFALESEISRLVETDFVALFKQLEKDFISQAHSDLAIELNKFEDKSNELKLDILERSNELKIEIDRLLHTDFNELFAQLQEDFIKKSRQDFEVVLKQFKNISEDLNKKISEKINALQSEINRLLDVDFTTLFKNLQKEFIDQTRYDLNEELKKFEDKYIKFNGLIKKLNIQVERLKQIDIQTYFDKHQNTLSEIFNAINSININMTNLTQLSSDNINKFSNFQDTFSQKHKKLNDIIYTNNKDIKDYLLNHNSEIINFMTSLEDRLKSSEQQNSSLKKQLIINWILQILSFCGIIGFIWYSVSF